MPWDQDVFVKNVLILVNKHCGGVQKTFNDKIDHRDAVTKWKKGSKPALDILLKIPSSFPCSLDWLLTGKEPPLGLFPGDKATYALSPEAKDAYPEIEDIIKYANKAVEINDTSILRSVLKGVAERLENIESQKKENIKEKCNGGKGCNNTPWEKTVNE